MYYVYESHLSGELYISGEQSYDELYCEQCGDADCFHDLFESKKEAEKYIEEYNNEE